MGGAEVDVPKYYPSPVRSVARFFLATYSRTAAVTIARPVARPKLPEIEPKISEIYCRITKLAAFRVV